MAQHSSSHSDTDEKLNYKTKLVVSAPSLDKITQYLDEYEICNTVKYTYRFRTLGFGCDNLPWKSKDLGDSIPQIQWQSGPYNIQYTGHPYIIVGTKGYNCCFGKNLKSTSKGKRVNREPRRCGCPALVNIQEILRLQSHSLPADVPYKEVTKPKKKAMNEIFNNELKRLKSGMPPDESFRWTREFYMNIHSLNSHNHVTGEPAGPHMSVDYRVKERILDLAKSGILELDIIKENITHYVENELFKDRAPPPKTNARFYPSKKVIYNHSRGKLKLIGKKLGGSGAAVVEGGKRQDSSCNIEDGLLELIAAVEEIETDNSAGPYSPVRPQYSVSNRQNLFTQQRPSLIQATEQKSYEYSHLEESDDEQSDGSDGTTSHSITTTHSQPLHSKTKLPSQRTAKDRFFNLIKKISRVGEILEDNSNFTMLSAALINVLMLAKPLVPQEKFNEIYGLAPRPTRLSLSTRKRKPRRPKPNKPMMPRRPDANPDFVPPTKKVRAVVRQKKIGQESAVKNETTTIKSEQRSRKSSLISKLLLSTESTSCVRATPLKREITDISVADTKPHTMVSHVLRVATAASAARLHNTSVSDSLTDEITTQSDLDATNPPLPSRRDSKKPKLAGAESTSAKSAIHDQLSDIISDNGQQAPPSPNHNKEPVKIAAKPVENTSASVANKQSKPIVSQVSLEEKRSLSSSKKTLTSNQSKDKQSKDANSAAVLSAQPEHVPHQTICVIHDENLCEADKTSIITDAVNVAKTAAAALDLNCEELTITVSKNEQDKLVYLLKPSSASPSDPPIILFTE